MQVNFVLFQMALRGFNQSVLGTFSDAHPELCKQLCQTQELSAVFQPAMQHTILGQKSHFQQQLFTINFRYIQNSSSFRK